jgi:hypothetical protein
VAQDFTCGTQVNPFLVVQASMVGFTLVSRSYYYLRRRSPGPPFPPDHRQAGERLWGNGGYDEIEFEKCRDFIFEPGDFSMDFRGEFIFVTRFLLLFIVVDVFTVSAFCDLCELHILLYAVQPTQLDRRRRRRIYTRPSPRSCGGPYWSGR